ncbi:uncharacterized protein [Arachis hypogaea]|uniref:uncharacterized protein n=1 Tax=Arachis hypogaea TaxID=3818 RepID=UPI000DEC5AA1|nr:uncharacterized protein LOC112763728 [Arachis hypogaea]
MYRVAMEKTTTVLPQTSSEHSKRVPEFHPSSNELQLFEERILNLTLSKIEDKLQDNGRSLKEYDQMPLLTIDALDGIDDPLIMDEMNFDLSLLKEELEYNLHIMNLEQREAFDKVISVVNDDVGGFFFVYGYGGTGKVYLYRTLSAAIRSRGEIVLNVASSGIASLLLPNGRTNHSRFKIPPDLNEDSVCCIKQRTLFAKLVCKAKLIIWDEVPMLNKLCYESLDKCLWDIMRYEKCYNSNLPFSGKVILLGGDFRQILPVIPIGSRQDIVQSSINSLYLWEFCIVMKLTTNMRLTVGASHTQLRQISQFAEWLLTISDGLPGDSSDGESEVNIPEDIIIQYNEDGFNSLVNFVYPNLLLNLNNGSYFGDRTILALTLEIVNDVNKHIMKSLIGEEKTYLSFDSFCVKEGNMKSELDTITPDVLNAINCSGLPPHLLALKEGVLVMLLRNIDQSNGLYNGTRLQVSKEPLVVSFSMTINKSQDQTLTTVELYLSKPVFTHGKLCVALSRVRSKSGVRILIENNSFKTKGTIINVVYREVFKNLGDRVYF